MRNLATRDKNMTKGHYTDRVIIQRLAIFVTFMKKKKNLVSVVLVVEFYNPNIILIY